MRVLGYGLAVKASKGGCYGDGALDSRAYNHANAACAIE